MFRRIINISKNNSLFIFGARGTGKSTLLEGQFKGAGTLWIDLLTDADESRYGRDPDELTRVLEAGIYQCVVIDEVQKAPKLLDIVHHEMGKHKKTQFVLTGSSARKLKRGMANLLAGRAFTYHLFPLTAFELGDAFNLKNSLELGTLPKLFEYESREEKNDFLRSYAKNYLREEILVEQLVRQLNPFRDFLEVAAQCNGTILNYSKVAKDIGVDDKTVTNYFSILEDTLIGFHLPAFHRSVRKQQRMSPKFFFFDPGIVRALNNTLRVELLPQTYAFGNAFEHWVILECFRLNEYYQLDYRFSYLQTKDGGEVDLIIQRPGKAELLVEIKSTVKVTGEHTAKLNRFQKSWGISCEAEVWSLDNVQKKDDGVLCIDWQTALKKHFINEVA